MRHGSSVLRSSHSQCPMDKAKGSHHIKKQSVLWEMALALSTRLRLRRSSPLLWGLGFCLICFFFIALPSFNSGQQRCDCHGNHNVPREVEHLPSVPDAYRSNPSDKHNMAILIPFRDRFEELMEFVPHLHNFLKLQRKNHHIYVINQVDNLRFNRASLLNIGFKESMDTCDYIAMHDVDLLPMNSALTYEFPEEGPYHVAAPHLHPRYHYPTFIGGILLVNREHFRLVDGLSNKYWGWGLEDDEFYARLKEAKLTVRRPGNLTTGTKDTFRHIHDRRVRRRDMIKCYNQQEVTRRRDRQTGLSTIRYHIQSRKEMTIEGAPLTILNVILECDRNVTPWCDCTENVGNTKPLQHKSENRDDVIVPKLDRKKHISHDG